MILWCSPFGLSLEPQVFSKVFCPGLMLLRQLGVSHEGLHGRPAFVGRIPGGTVGQCEDHDVIPAALWMGHEPQEVCLDPNQETEVSSPGSQLKAGYIVSLDRYRIEAVVLRQVGSPAQTTFIRQAQGQVL